MLRRSVTSVGPSHVYPPTSQPVPVTCEHICFLISLESSGKNPVVTKPCGQFCGHQFLISKIMKVTVSKCPNIPFASRSHFTACLIEQHPASRCFVPYCTIYLIVILILKISIK
jgi:hypothetical protein